MTESNDVGSEYEGLVRQAMGQGLQGLDCTLVQLPSDQNGHHGVVLASATTERGMFRAVGEAWRDLLPPARRGETLTTAEIRAKSRVLREALGMPALPMLNAPAPSRSNSTDQPVSVPDRKVENVGEGVEAATRSTAGAASASASSGPAGDASASLGGTEPRTRQIGPPGRSTPGRQPNETVDGAATARGPHESAAPVRPSQMIVDGLSTDMVNKLLEMTKRKAAMEGNSAGDEEARQRLDSYFQRAFGHPLSEASRMEGQRVIQRLAADLSRTGAGQGRAVTG